MKNLSTILALFALLVSCKSSQKQAVQRLESAKVRITSIGRGQNRKTCESTDITLLREIRKELGNIRPYVQKREDGDAPTKVNYGFYEVELFSADLKVTSFLIVYTGFTGSSFSWITEIIRMMTWSVLFRHFQRIVTVSNRGEAVLNETLRWSWGGH